MSFIMFKIECDWFLSPSENTENSWSLIIIIQKYSLSYSSFNMLCLVEVNCVELRRSRAISWLLRWKILADHLQSIGSPLFDMVFSSSSHKYFQKRLPVSPKLWAVGTLTGYLFDNLPNKHEKTAITSSPWQGCCMVDLATGLAEGQHMRGAANLVYGLQNTEL